MATYKSPPSYHSDYNYNGDSSATFFPTPPSSNSRAATATTPLLSKPPSPSPSSTNPELKFWRRLFTFILLAFVGVVLILILRPMLVLSAPDNDDCDNCCNTHNFPRPCDSNDRYYSISTPPSWGNTYILRLACTDKIVTVDDNGAVNLMSPQGSFSLYRHGLLTTDGSSHWECVESKGWLGFRNAESGRYLGHDHGGNLVNRAVDHKGWENFVSEHSADGGYILKMTHYERLWHLGVVGESEGEPRLAKMDYGIPLVWEFIKV
ncbi:hypothetical protein MKZ38_005772 [Zalerion maritima]|uniref:Uncharacterized protein n=1 Tax=Zalerion maritima TaxID=339359 RepID=A0AAD5RJN9_9PEZI|nr:hypothetical protein MKZ38_005772 [Zalerion maritima]